MSKWKQTIQIKDLLAAGTDAAAIKKTADAIIERLPTEAPTSRLIKARDMADDDADTALLVFNRGLDSIYDWADDNSIWLA